MEKKADAIVKLYNDAELTDEEWKIVSFYVHSKARPRILHNILTFYDGLQYYRNSGHFDNVPGQMTLDLGVFDGTY